MILIGVLVLVICLVIYLLIPYSPVKKEYFNTVKELTKEYKLPKNKITEGDLKSLPEIMQKYFIKNGYIGVDSANSIIFNFKDVDFSMGPDKGNIKIDYTVYAFANEPTRIALIDSKIYGIPFQGIDTTKDGRSSIKGVLAKHIPLFNESFNSIDSAYLTECILHPSLALQKNISYKQLDDYSVEATITKNGASIKGIFYFNEKYEMTKFIDEKRFCTETGTYEKWSVILGDYKRVNGINLPTKLQTIWNYDSGDFMYFNSGNSNIYFQ